MILTASMSALAACGDGPSDSADRPPRVAASLTRSFGTDDAAKICDLSPSGCGRAPKTDLDRHPVAVAVHELQRTFLAGDTEGVCKRITKAAAIQAGSMAHGQPSTCAANVEHAFTLLDNGNGWTDAQNPEVARVQVTGKTALATVAVKDRQVAQVPFEKDGGSWKLDGFFGAAAGAVPSFVRSVPKASFPRGGGRQVEVADASGKRCGDLSAARFPLVSGGCKIQVLGKKLALTIMTPFGSFKFGDCLVSYEFRVDGQGRTWTTFHTVDGPLETGCGDVNTCEKGTTLEQVPWRGRISAGDDGAFVHRVDMCLDTCVGVFIGQMRTRLVRQGGRWRAEDVNADVGASGLRLNGPLTVKPPGFDIRAADA